MTEAFYCGRLYKLGDTSVLVKREAYPVAGIPKTPLGVYTLSNFFLGYMQGYVGEDGGPARYPDFEMNTLVDIVGNYAGLDGAGKLAREMFPPCSHSRTAGACSRPPATTASGSSS